MLGRDIYKRCMKIVKDFKRISSKQMKLFFMSTVYVVFLKKKDHIVLYLKDAILEIQQSFDFLKNKIPAFYSKRRIIFPRVVFLSIVVDRILSCYGKVKPSVIHP